MKGLLILFNNQAERYLIDSSLVRCWIDHNELPEGRIHIVRLEFDDEDSKMGFYNISIKAEQFEEIYNRVCESYLNHPGIIDLRGLNVSLDDIEEN